MARMLVLGENGRYRIERAGQAVPVEDPWDPELRLLRNPRPGAEAAWKVLFGYDDGAGDFVVVLLNVDSGDVREWHIDDEGRFQRQSLPTDLTTRKMAAEDLAPHPALLTFLIQHDLRRARSMAIRILRRSPANSLAAKFLSDYYAAAGHFAKSRHYWSRYLRSKLPQPGDQRTQARGLSLALRHFESARGRQDCLLLLQSPGRLEPSFEHEIRQAGYDFLCLTFKREVRAPGYLFAPGTTWTQGRNTLFAACRQMMKRYRSYVFADGDVRFEGTSVSSGLSLFRQAMMREEPEILTAATPWHPHWGYPELHGQDYARIGGFDAILNGFRQDVFFEGILFPYLECFDATSWWASQQALLLLSERYYAAWQLPSLIVSDGPGSSYPRGDVGPAVEQIIARLTSGGRARPRATTGLEADLVKRFNREAFNRALRDSIYAIPMDAG